MFTGIIAAQSKITRVSAREEILLVSVKKPKRWSVKKGESVAVNGICSTVVQVRRDEMEFEYVPETIRKTTVTQWKKGTPVNLELSLGMGDRLSGHFVLGHTDGIGKINRVKREGDSRVWEIEIPSNLLRYIAPKGSIAVDGVSLTIVRKLRRGFSVALIPYTLHRTTLDGKRAGNRVNVECDMLAKYLLHAKSRE